MTAERKYTDRDVRENPELKEIALRYLNVYGGDFEPLVNAQGMLAAGRELPTNIVRVVLNCMRHDRDYAADMPQPEAKVIQMPRTKKRKKYRYDVCGSTDVHRSHQVESEEFDWRCPGITNGRMVVPYTAKIKVPYAKAKGGKMVHIVHPNEESYFTYNPNAYEPGFSERYVWDEKGEHYIRAVSADLNVKLLCKYPSWLRNPHLLREVPKDTFNYDGTPLELCRHCKEISDADYQEMRNFYG